MANTKEVRLSDFIFECQNVQFTQDWFNLTRECYECELMDQYAESVKFVLENADRMLDDNCEEVFEEGVFFEKYTRDDLLNSAIDRDTADLIQKIDNTISVLKGKGVLKNEGITAIQKENGSRMLTELNGLHKAVDEYVAAYKKYRVDRNAPKPSDMIIQRIAASAKDISARADTVKGLQAQLKSLANKAEKVAREAEENQFSKSNPDTGKNKKEYEGRLKDRMNTTNKTLQDGSALAPDKHTTSQTNDPDSVSITNLKKKRGVMEKILNFLKKIIKGVVNFFKKITGKLDETTKKALSVRAAFKKKVAFANADEAYDFANGIIGIAMPNNKPLIDLSYTPDSTSGLKIPSIAVGGMEKLNKLVAARTGKNASASADMIVGKIIGAALETNTVTLGVNPSIVKSIASPNDGNKEIGLVTPSTLASSVKKINGGSNKNELYTIIGTFEKEWTDIKKNGYDINVDTAAMQKVSDECDAIAKELDKKSAAIIENINAGVTASDVNELKKLYGAISNVSGNMMSVYSNYITFRTNVVNYLEKFVNKKVSSK